MTEYPVGMMHEIRCAKCGRALSRPLRILTDWHELATEDGVPLLPSGRLAIAGPELLNPWNGREPFSEHTGAPIACIGDLQNTEPTGIRNGCCGPDGCNGPNLACVCGQVIGTEQGDCWQTHFVEFGSLSVLVAAVQTRPDA